MPRFFIPQEDVQGSVLYVREDAHHISHVLRMSKGEILTLCDGSGMDYECTITAFEEDAVVCTLVQAHRSSTEPLVELTLFQGVPKSDKMEWIIEKGVEVGISHFVPVNLKRCISRPEDRKMAAKVDRWNKISRAAGKQSGRGRIPDVSLPLSTAQMCRAFSDYDAVLVCYEEKKNSLRALLEQLKMQHSSDGLLAPMKVGIVIGPEGGLEASEVEQMKAAGGLIVGLGPRILRTETAGMTAAAVVLYEMGCMDPVEE